MRKTFFISLLFISLQSSAQNRIVSSGIVPSYTVRIAETVLKTWKDSFAVYNNPAKWTYDMGVILKGFEGL